MHRVEDHQVAAADCVRGEDLDARTQERRVRATVGRVVDFGHEVACPAHVGQPELRCVLLRLVYDRARVIDVTTRVELPVVQAATTARMVGLLSATSYHTTAGEKRIRKTRTN